MVRFSQTLDDKHSVNREKHYEQMKDNTYYYSREERQPNPVQRPTYPERQVYQREEPSDIVYERPVIERKSIQPDYSKPELQFPDDQIFNSV